MYFSGASKDDLRFCQIWDERVPTFAYWIAFSTALRLRLTSPPLKKNTAWLFSILSRHLQQYPAIKDPASFYLKSQQHVRWSFKIGLHFGTTLLRTLSQRITIWHLFVSNFCYKYIWIFIRVIFWYKYIWTTARVKSFTNATLWSVLFQLLFFSGAKHASSWKSTDIIGDFPCQGFSWERLPGRLSKAMWQCM